VVILPSSVQITSFLSCSRLTTWSILFSPQSYTCASQKSSIETPLIFVLIHLSKTMPRLPVHREPKPQQGGNANSQRSGRSPQKPSTFQAHLVAATGEFVGTFMFLYFSFACQMMLTTQASETSLVNGGPSSQQNIFTALVYGFSLLVNVWAFYRISGGLFNPAVRILESVQCQTRPDFLTKY
jgi:hypothetical protein